MRYSRLTVPDYKVWDGKKRRYVTKKKYYKDEASILTLLNYVKKVEKDGEGVAYCGGRNLNPNDTVMSQKLILKVQKHYKQESGRRMYHFILSFPPKVKDAYDVYMAGEIIAHELFNDSQVLYAVHTDTDNLHVHFVFSSVKKDGRKWNFSGRKFREFKNKAECLADELFSDSGKYKVWHCPPAEVQSMEELLAD